MPFPPTITSLAAAATWGAADFNGGMAAKRAPVIPVGALSQAMGAVFMASLALAFGESMLTGRVLWLAMAAGAGNALGITSLYRALSSDKMGIGALVAAVITAVLPVIVGIAGQGWPGPLKLVGFVLAILGIWLLARPEEQIPKTKFNSQNGVQETGSSQNHPDTAGAPFWPVLPGRGFSTERPEAESQNPKIKIQSWGGRPALRDAVLAGVGFSGFLVLIRYAGNSDQAFWALAVARATPAVIITIIGLATRARWSEARPVAALIILAGVLDSSGGLLFALASHHARLDVATVLASLYPASTVILARIILKERLTRVQAAGMLAALIAVPLIAA